MKAFAVGRYGSEDGVQRREMPEPGMKASGEQLRAIAALADAGTIRPVIDRVIPFESAKDALAYVESGRARGKVIITMADLPATHPVTPPAARTPAPLTHIPSTERAQP
jgi:NADPH:quinone reductase-like Zn-dependent oxidoreductase